VAALHVLELPFTEDSGSWQKEGNMTDQLTLENTEIPGGTGVKQDRPLVKALDSHEKMEVPQKPIVEALGEDRLDRLIADMGLFPRKDSPTYRRYRKVLKDFTLEINDKLLDGVTQAAAIYLKSQMEERNEKSS